RIFHELGYRLAATAGTARCLRDGGVPVAVEVAKLGDEAPRGKPDAVQMIAAGEVHLVVNSPHGRGPRADGEHIRSAVGRAGLPLLTTGAAALAAADGLRDSRDHSPAVNSLQEYHARLKPAGAGSG
ncbi:MAG: carbamoyl phosphate synthase large subunit, partial [Acidimicrobiaceae bacterium]|nr:carbamoyl phosphate synthase large subunit [Acidimicrobiaceae bacterium]